MRAHLMVRFLATIQGGSHGPHQHVCGVWDHGNNVILLFFSASSIVVSRMMLNLRKSSVSQADLSEVSDMSRILFTDPTVATERKARTEVD